MSGHRSIGYHLNKRGKTDEDKKTLVLEWAVAWEAEQLQLIRSLEQSIRYNNHDLFANTMGLLKESTDKKFTALRNIANKIDTFKIKDDQND